jgi:tetratricopeptide (TPR) repeat protein
MSRRLSRPHWAWTILIAGMVVVIVSLGVADRYLGNRAPWRRLIVHRGDSEALALGHRLLERGQNRRAIQAVSRIEPGNSSEAEALTIRGLAEANLEEVGPARQDLERAWKLQPNAAAARVLAAIYLSAFENDRGLMMLLNASRIDAKDFRPWYAMGELVYLRLRHYEAAIDAFQEALDRLPGHFESRVGLAEALVKSHRSAEAEPILKGVLDERPDDPRALTLAAEVALDLGRDADPGRLLERSLAIDPDRRDTLVLHARVQLRGGHAREALAEAERACALEPNDLAALSLLSSIQSALGMKDQAAGTLARRREVEQRNQQIEALLQVIKEKPDDPETRCRLARAAAEAGMKPLAVQSYQVALVLAPDCQPARRGLIELGFSPSQLPPETAGRSTRGGTHR